MGKIMLNEISYSGGGGGNADIVRLTQAEYDALPSSKLTDDKVYMITDVNGDGSQFQPVIYSENEREIGVWTDGKPLYEKTFLYSGSLQNDTWYTVTSDGDTTRDIKNVVGYFYSSATKFPIPYYRLGNYTAFTVDNDYELTILFDIGGVSMIGYVATIQYTKSTDTAGSGTWTPQGVPAVHYSTDEKVVGVDEDGNTLYEKFYRVANVYSTNTVVDSTKTPTNTRLKSLIFGSFTIGGAYNNTQYCTPHIGTNADIRIFMNENGLSINAEGFNTSTYPITDCYFRIQYTKIQGGA